MGEYIVLENACTGQRSQCLNQRRNDCELFVCPSSCGSNNDVTFCEYNDSNENCTYLCECTSPRPNCPGSSSCNGGQWQCDTPILVDVADDGFRLTAPVDGVTFDLSCDGMPQRHSWTYGDSDDGWLVLDPPPAGEQKNGFLALAVFDRSEEGGNSDGYIDVRDTVYERLRIWQDLNHDGVSQVAELKTLPETNVGKIELDHKVKHRVDEHGNAFYYRARRFDNGGHRIGFLWDVFLATAR